MGSITNAISGMLGAASGQNAAVQSAVSFDRSAFDPNSDEQSLTQALIARANGQGQSVAEQQMMKGLDQSNQAAMGMAASQRGVSPALAARLAAQQQGQNATQTNQAAGMMRAQEQMANQQLLTQALQSQRQARMNREQLSSSNQLGISNINSQAQEAANQRAAGFISNLGSSATAAAMMMASDGGIAGMQNADAQTNSSFQSAIAQAFGQAMAVRMIEKQEQPQFGQEMLQGALAGRSKNPAGAPMSAASPVGAPTKSAGPASVMTNALNNGGKVKGPEIQKGDSPKNDVVPAMLSAGEMVIPKTVVQKGPDAISAFAAGLLAQQKAKG